jgi:SAM-dependent methyltransferase
MADKPAVNPSITDSWIVISSQHALAVKTKGTGMPLKTDPRIAFFDHHAPKWDTYGPPAEHTLARLEALLPALGLEAGQDMLEVGCGTGQVTGWLESTVRPGRVTAVDFSPAMIDAARQRGVSASFVLADVCGVPLGSACFDVAFCMHVFPHFRDAAAALSNIARSLKPGGRLVVVHLIGRAQINHVHHHAGGPVAEDRLPDGSHWALMLEKVGLHLLEVRDEKDLFLLTAMKGLISRDAR